MDGRVAAVRDGLVVLALIGDDIVPNGFVVLRTADITFVKYPAPYAELVEKVLGVRGGEQRFSLPSKPMSWGGVLESAAKYWPLAAVHTETAQPDVVFIGQVTSIPSEGAVMSLRLVGPDGKWKKKAMAIPVGDISRIDFGGRYEEALAIAVGLAPKMKRRPVRRAARSNADHLGAREPVNRERRRP
jgi:hypothetical protein